MGRIRVSPRHAAHGTALAGFGARKTKDRECTELIALRTMGPVPILGPLQDIHDGSRVADTLRHTEGTWIRTRQR